MQTLRKQGLPIAMKLINHQTSPTQIQRMTSVHSQGTKVHRRDAQSKRPKDGFPQNLMTSATKHLRVMRASHTMTKSEAIVTNSSLA